MTHDASIALQTTPHAAERAATATRSAARITAAKRTRFAAPSTPVARLKRVAAPDVAVAALAPSVAAKGVAPKDIFAVTEGA